MNPVRRNYVVLILLGLLFAAPGITAYFFYLNPTWLGNSTTNKGALLSPPVLLVDSKPGSKWRLVVWSSDTCEQDCIAELDKLARIRLALGRHLYKVDSQLLINAQTPPLSEGLVKTLHEQDIQTVRLSQEERGKMRVLQNDLEIFIVNPDGYLVLAYQPTVKPEDIFHDLKQLVTK